MLEQMVPLRPRVALEVEERRPIRSLEGRTKGLGSSPPAALRRPAPSAPPHLPHRCAGSALAARAAEAVASARSN